MLNRYDRLLTYTDTPRRVVESPYRKGLAVLEQFAAARHRADAAVVRPTWSVRGRSPASTTASR